MKKNKEDYTREEYIYLSKLYEKAQRYEDMTSSIIKFIELNPKLSKEERNILSAGYKDILLDKRENWRFLNLMERKELKKKSKQATYIKEIKNHIEKEIKKIVEEMEVDNDKDDLKEKEDEGKVKDPEKEKFKAYLMDILAKEEYINKRAIKMSIDEFLKLLDILNNNGIHLNQ